MEEITFDKLWNDIVERSQRFGIPIVQDYKELEHVFNLMRGCKSYLEIGTAEGNGLYVLSYALKEDANITIIDFGEKHTFNARNEVITKLDKVATIGKDGLLKGLFREIYGNSHSAIVQKSVPDKGYEIVFIDAGHSYEDVIADAIAYGHLATKYIFFHDIQLPPVRKAYEWYAVQNPQMKKSEFINSDTYGYGILEI